MVRICCTDKAALLVSTGDSLDLEHRCQGRQLKYVGHSVPRVDGIEKVTGKAKFLGDLAIPGMLHGKILRSSYPHARILAIDTSRAESLPGVAAVFTAADLGDPVPTYNGRPVIAANKFATWANPWRRWRRRIWRRPKRRRLLSTCNTKNFLR